jgi:SulP family sulfate permease
VLGLRRRAPALPGSLIVVVLAIGAVELFGLGDEIAIVGPIDSGLPSLGIPDVGLDDFGALAAGAIGIMLVGFSEGLGAAKTYAGRAHERIDPDRELVGIGAANLGAGLSSGMVVNGSLSKTAVNASAGARSQLAGLVAALLTALTLLLFTGLFESLPEATLAAVVVAALVELVDIPALHRLYRVFTGPLGRIYGFAARADFIAAVAAMLGVMVFDTLPGLFIGIALSLLLLLYRSSRPNVAVLGRVQADGRWEDVARHGGARRERGVVVLRPESGLFFANSDAVRDRILAAARGNDVRAVVIDGETVPFIDVTAARMLEDVAAQLAAQGTQLILARGVGQVRDVIRATDVPADRGELTVASTVEDAVGLARSSRRW